MRRIVPAFSFILMKLIAKFLQKIKERAKRTGYGCDICGEELFDYPNRRVCNTCRKTLYGEAQPICPKCGRVAVTSSVCLTCKSRVPAFYKGFSPFAYEGEVALQLKRLKQGNRRLAFFFAEEMSNCFLNGVSKENRENLLIIPVPLTEEKRKLRGYNQAEELAEHIHAVFTAHGVDCELDFQVLQKKRETENQKSLGFFDRAENVSGVYHVHKRKACRGKTILLVDDIMTTGATASVCAKLLYSAGADRVYALCTASVPERR